MHWTPHPDAALEAALRDTPAAGLRDVLAHPSVQADPYARLRALDRLHAAQPHARDVEDAWLQHLLIGNRPMRAWAHVRDWAPETLDLGRLLLAAQVAQVVGEHAAAALGYRLALARFPASVDAWQKAVEFDRALLPDNAEARLRELSAGARDDYVGEKAAFALATLLEARDPNAAFAFAADAHRLKRQRIGAWDAAAFDGVLEIDRRRQPARPSPDHPLPAAATFPRVAGEGLQGSTLSESSRGLRPIFIVGLPRSGTTLLSALLGAHPRIAQAGEQNLIPTLSAGACREPALVDAERNAFCAHWYRAAVGDLAGDADHIVDKLPANAAHIGLILALFPDALVLHCQRGAADNAISIWLHDFEFGCRFGNSANDLARYASALHTHAAHWRTRAPARVLPVAYEALVADPAATLAPVLAALGLHWRDDLTAFWQDAQPIGTHSETQLRRPINADSIGRWRRFLPAAQAWFDRVLASDPPSNPRDADARV